MTDSEYIHVVKARPQTTSLKPTYVYKSKEDRINDHIGEMSDEELIEYLANGKTVYGAESPLDTDTDIADQMQDELDDRRHQRRIKMRHNLIWCYSLKRCSRLYNQTTLNARKAARVYAIKHNLQPNQWGAFS